METFVLVFLAGVIGHIVGALIMDLGWHDRGDGGEGEAVKRPV